MKKLFGFTAVAALLVAAVAPAFAYVEIDDSTIRIRSRVRSEVRADSNTGDNWAVNLGVMYRAQADDTSISGGNTMNTGTADSMGVNTVVVNTLTDPVLADGGEMEDSLFTSRARVRSYTDVYANSGRNIAINGFGLVEGEVDDLTVNANNNITTGDAIATGDSLVVVNSTWDGAM